MPKLTNISGRQAVKAFLLKSQVKRAEISIDDFIKALK